MMRVNDVIVVMMVSLIIGVNMQKCNVKETPNLLPLRQPGPEG